MKSSLIWTITLLTILVSSVLADDLYQVMVLDEPQAVSLKEAGVDPVLRLNQGYLVLTDPAGRQRMSESGLILRLIARDLTRAELALDGRRDRVNVERHELLFEQEGLRLYRQTGGPRSPLGLMTDQIFPIGDFRPEVEFVETGRSLAVPDDLQDLLSLIALVDTDSLTSYVGALQAFNGRVAGTASNRQARDWIRDKLIQFGYLDSYLQTFDAPIGGTTTCYNVVATKTGTTYPDSYIVVGAHFDAVTSSPGADDNGSGTAGVLELARILQDVPTDLSIMFVTYDAEEYGLHGSWYHADQAAAAGEDIVFMLNMDMIGFQGNVNQSALYYGSDRSYAELWQHLADSLISLEGLLAGASGASDHHPYSQHGIPVAFAAEYVFSSVYHTYQDSTTYIDFDYMTKLVQISLATAYVATMPQPYLTFAHPYGLPDILTFDQTTQFSIEVQSVWGGVPVPGTELLHYSTDGLTYVSTPMAAAGGESYQATLPAFPCVDRVYYYFSAEDATGGETYVDLGPENPAEAIVATSQTTYLADNFETSSGWTVSGSVADGPWERAVPTNGGTRGDPAADYDGSGYCWVSDNDVNGDIDGGTTILTSNAYDLSGARPRISYARWYSNNFGADPNNDIMEVFISNGGEWELVETVGPVQDAAGGWIEHNFVVSDFVEPTSTVSLRFEASDLGSGSVVEAALDDLNISFCPCEGKFLQILTDLLPDAQLGVGYSTQLTALRITGEPQWIDLYGDLDGTGLALSGHGLLSGTPLSNGLVTFTAVVNDDWDLPDTALMTLTVGSCCEGRVGDANGEGGDEPTIGDVSILVELLFIKSQPDLVVCLTEADINQSGGVNPTLDDLSIGDISYLVDYLFITGETLGLNDCF